MNKEQKKLLWKRLRKTMCYDKKDGGAVFKLRKAVEELIESKDMRHLKHLMGYVEQVDEYVKGLESGSRELLNAKYYKIAALENEIKEMKIIIEEKR